MIADVKDYFDDTFSNDVYAHFGLKRKNNDFGINLIYSIDKDLSIDAHYGEVNDGFYPYPL